jgi:hypothetical protein
MNFPNSLLRNILSAVRLIFGSVANVPKRLADNRDDQVTAVLLQRSALKAN